MKTRYAIITLQKRKTKAQVAHSHRHNSRIGKTPDNADPNGPAPRLLAGEADLRACLAARLPSQRRSDAVIAAEFVLTASPEFFDGATQEQKDAWEKANIEWLRKTHGDNLLQAIVHDDETTKHIHAYWIPLVDGKLNFKAQYGTPAKMRELQSDYARAMAQFGLKRGKPSARKHRDTIEGMAEKISSLEGQLERARRAAKKLARCPLPVDALGPLKDLAGALTGQEENQAAARRSVEAPGGAGSALRARREDAIFLKAAPRATPQRSCGPG